MIKCHAFLQYLLFYKANYRRILIHGSSISIEVIALNDEVKLKGTYSLTRQAETIHNWKINDNHLFIAFL